MTIELREETHLTKASDEIAVGKSQTPPRAPLAFRVGVVGHRPNRLGKANLDQLAATVHAILSIVKEETQAAELASQSLFDGAGAVLRAYSPLAEGTDRIFAEQAKPLGFELCCVMPFHRAEFENDFGPGRALEEDSLSRFRRLLAEAVTCFELDGTRAETSEAYGAAGRVILNQSDLLLVVWDGERLGKRGGTEETFGEALSRGVPVVWIDAHAPHPWQVLGAATQVPRVPDGERAVPDATGSAETLRNRVRQAIELPALTEADPRKTNSKHIEPRDALEQFYAEARPRRTRAFFWKAFVQLLADARRPSLGWKVPDFEDAAQGEWPRGHSDPIASLVDKLRPFYAWPDNLAVLYANRYRSAFLLTFLIAAAAVGLALLPLGLGLTEHRFIEIAFIMLEFTAILFILAMVVQGRLGRWHERWIDYRFTAELVRHLRMVAPLGGRRPFPQIPAHWATYGQPGASWMAWYVRAVERALALPSVAVDRAYLDGYLAHLANLLNGQIDFHETTARRCHSLEQRLHGFGFGLFALTLLACGLHLALSVFEHALQPTWEPNVLTFLCGFCPALGAALAGIANQGEFRRLAKRSEAMRDQLSRLLKMTVTLRQRIDLTPDSALRQTSPEAASLAGAAASLLLNEVFDWRVVLLDQPLRPPA